MSDQIEPDLLLDIQVAEVDGDGHEQGGQQHQKEADAVHAHVIAQAEQREPGDVLHELHPGDRVVPVDPEQQAHQESDQGRAQGRSLFARVVVGERHNHRAEQRQEGDDAEKIRDRKAMLVYPGLMLTTHKTPPIEKVVDPDHAARPERRSR